jgi:hypothetical protein
MAKSTFTLPSVQAFAGIKGAAIVAVSNELVGAVARLLHSNDGDLFKVAANELGKSQKAVAMRHIFARLEGAAIAYVQSTEGADFRAMQNRKKTEADKGAALSVAGGIVAGWHDVFIARLAEIKSEKAATVADDKADDKEAAKEAAKEEKAATVATGLGRAASQDALKEERKRTAQKMRALRATIRALRLELAESKAATKAATATATKAATKKAATKKAA